jgi:hypothetical protein
MARSRSSFDDLAAAIASASSLEPAKPASPPVFRGAPLVSFSLDPAPESSTDATPPARFPTEAEIAVVRAAAPRDPESARLDEAAAVAAESVRKPPKLPDLSAVVSPIVRCEKIVEWIIEATSASDVFLADASGMPLAGAVVDAEARLAGTGVVASAVAQLATSIPGNTSAIFEMHLGEGPFFQLIGFQVAGALYLVGLSRSSPLTPRQAHAIRLACRHALGEVVPTT